MEDETTPAPQPAAEPAAQPQNQATPAMPPTRIYNQDDLGTFTRNDIMTKGDPNPILPDNSRED